jgi:carbon-monoxide dehydrogenase large subunit
MSLGTALMERTVYDENGQLLTGEFMDYAIPRAPDIPEYILGSTETPSPSMYLHAGSKAPLGRDA